MFATLWMDCRRLIVLSAWDDKSEVQKTIKEYLTKIYLNIASSVLWTLCIIIQKKKEIMVDSAMAGIDVRKMNSTSWLWILLSLACIDRDFSELMGSSEKQFSIVINKSMDQSQAIWV